MEYISVEEYADAHGLAERTVRNRCIDFVIGHAAEPVSESMIKQLHCLLRYGISDASRSWFAVGGYKRLPGEAGGMETVRSGKVGMAIRSFLKDCKSKTKEWPHIKGYLADTCLAAQDCYKAALDYFK